MPEEPRIDDRYVNPEGSVFRVICVHPPYVTARKRRGWAVTLMSEEEEQSRMHLVTMDMLVKGGFTNLTVPR